MGFILWEGRFCNYPREQKGGGQKGENLVHVVIERPF
jgi:hypothetical protein